MAVRTADRTTTSSRSFMTFLSHIQAAVDRPDLPGDVGRLVSGQEADDTGDLLRPAEPADGNLPLDPIEHLIRDRRHHVRGDVARRHRIHRHADPVTGWPLRAV